MDSDPEKGMEVQEVHQSVGEENSSRRLSGNGTRRSASRRRSSSMSRRQSGSLSRIHSPRREARIDLDPENPGQWVVDHHKHNLIEELKQPTGNFLWRIFNTRHKDSALRRFRISFAELQRMRIRKLQCQLVKDVIQMRKNGSEPDDWETTLDHYIKALQDYDYMDRCSSQLSRDPFLVSGEYYVDNYVFDRCMPKELLLTERFGEIPSIKPWETGKDTTTPICGTRSDNRHRTWFQSFQTRVEIATIGGAFLIGPMWLMVLRNTLYTSLISTTAFVAAFGFIMALFLQDYKDVLASTAAYAAVLVVFVGTSTSNSP